MAIFDIWVGDKNFTHEGSPETAVHMLSQKIYMGANSKARAADELMRHGATHGSYGALTYEITKVKPNVGSRSKKGRIKNPSIGDYFRAGKKAALSAAESAAAEAKAAAERARKAAAEEAESRKVDSPEKALRILAAAHGYELVKKNRGRARKNPGCSCGGKCAPCASRKRRRKVAR